MKNPRKSIPKKVHDSVMREYSHLCSICASHSPQLHHIDEDPENSVEQNLLPLCPNCHLRDQHSPTRAIEIERLLLFRVYKDPAILSAQFQPLFKRLAFLGSPADTSKSADNLSKLANELVEFVAALHMGTFYSSKIKELIEIDPFLFAFSLYTPDNEYEQKLIEHDRQYRRKLLSARARVEELVMELLRYQQWKYDRP